MKKNYFKLILISLLLASLNIFATDIYVSKDGNDGNPGTIDSPYLTITKAASIAIAGDVVYIREGTYEETLTPINSGAPGNPITFQSYPGEKVIITTMQALSGWTQDSGSIYKTTVPFSSLEDDNFVIHKETTCNLARWPNKVDENPFALTTLRNTGGSTPEITNGAYLTENSIPAIDWTGGAVFFYGDSGGAGWIAWKERITSSTTGRVNFNLNKNPTWIRTVHAPSKIGDFYLEGVKAALDYQNEWYFNESTKELFIQVPGGSAPNDGDVKMRKRQLTINLTNKSYINIKDLAVFGGQIVIDGNANNNLIHSVSSFYGSYTLGIVTGFSVKKASILLGGSDNVIEKCEIAYGAGSGIDLKGNRNEVRNSRIHDFNFLGSYDAPINSRNGSDSKILNNTIFNGGRDAIQAFNSNSVFAYNDVYRSNLIADDCGLFYTVGGPRNIEVHHNWFHDAESSGTKKKAAGIYLDNDASAFKVHHNVIWNTEWTNIQINWNGKDLEIYNNTLWNGSGVMGAWHKEGTAFSNVKVWNNLGGDNKWEPQSDKQNNQTVDASIFVDPNKGNFKLKAGVTAIDAGRTITGITDGYTGTAPDIGAYEYGGNNWVAGIDWDHLYGPTENGCYGLPGEDCIEFLANDDDKDGVTNDKDLCPNTPLRTTVNTDGCPIFEIASDNFKILGKGETCANSNNGSISIISNDTSLSFTAKIEETASQKTFTSNTQFDNLEGGMYTICITTTTNTEYKQCFNVIVDEPENLSVTSKTNQNKKQVSLTMSGSNSYRIEFNGITSITNSNEITLNLQDGENTILVKTDKDCQGKYSEKIKIFDKITLFPNTVKNELTVAFPSNIKETVNYQIVSSSGQILIQKNANINTKRLNLNLETLNPGMYFILINSQNINFQSKIIKQ